MVSLAAAPPAAFVVAPALDRAETRPVVSAGSGSAITQWHASRAPEGDETFLTACVATPIPGWVEDMRASVVARTTGMTAASAEKMVGRPVEARADEAAGEGALRLFAPGGGDATTQLGTARTFIGFEGRSVVTCFATCTGEAGGVRTCDASVTEAHLEGGSAAPPAGTLLGSVTWAVHHPERAAFGGAVLVAVLGVIAVASRRRPRSRI